MELFDVVDAYGNPTGSVIERAKAHETGIRHRTSHVWLLRKKEGQIEILLQKRSDNKDSFPGCWDTSSAGHIIAGTDYVESALRELEEELHVEAKADQLVDLGLLTFQYDEVFHGKRFIDHQVSRIFVLWLDQESPEFRLQLEELSEIRWMPFQECWDMVLQQKEKNCINIEELELIKNYYGI